MVAVYSWVWARLPGPTPVRAVIAAVAGVVAVALLVLVVTPLLRPTSAFSDQTDPSGADPEQVVEPDGVRSAPPRSDAPAEPSPVVPEDRDVPQQ